MNISQNDIKTMVACANFVNDISNYCVFYLVSLVNIVNKVNITTDLLLNVITIRLDFCTFVQYESKQKHINTFLLIALL
jgi:hypothetical protein